MSRRGTTLLEVLFALIILSVALLPIIQHGGQVHRQSYSTEYRLLGQLRARFLIETIAAMDFDLLHQYASRSASGSGGQPVPFEVEELLRIGQADGPPLLTLFASGEPRHDEKLRQLRQLATIRPVSVDLLEIEVRVFWTLPDQPQDARQIQLARLLHRPEATMTRKVPSR